MILIIDGNNLAHRCKHTFSLSNRGMDVSVTYGFIRVLGSLLHKYRPDSVIVCWDMGVPEFRKTAVPEYKANRHKDDDPEAYGDFLRQMHELQEYALPLMGVISVGKVGSEADDLMYHASRMVDDDCIIVSTDRDMLQAVTETVSVLHPIKDKMYKPEDIMEIYGVPVNRFVDWRALQGDSSDNIPGVVGIGEKTATKLFKQYGTLTSIVNAALGHHPTDNLKGRLADNILSFGLDRITKNVYITSLHADRVGARQAIIDAVYSFKPANKTRVRKYFMRNSFVSLLDGTVFKGMLRLKEPPLKEDIMRIPIVLGRKRVAYG